MDDTSARLLEILRSVFGHSSFREGQEEIVRRVMAGGHSLALMPTGGGKSLCYQLPALALDGLTLVVSPLIALMKDQVDALRRKGVDACFINSSLDKRERESRYAMVAEGGYKLLYVTPERFRKPEFAEIIRRRRVALLAVDEAHCISQWGHDFRPDYTRLAEIRRLLGSPTTIALTATATPEVQRDIVRSLDLAPRDVRVFKRGIGRPNLRLDVRHVWGADEKLDHIERVRNEFPGSGIVYFSLIRTLEDFSDRLGERGIAHRRYHGSLETGERRRVQDVFMRGRNELVLVTNAFGMGVDKEDIRHVVHAETPGSMESYYQEIGRAGRDGRPSECALLYDQRDLEIQMRFIEWSNPSASYYHRLRHLLADRRDETNAFGLDWLRERMHHKDRGNRTLETALGMLDHYGVTEGSLEDGALTAVSELPPDLASVESRATKLRRDREKLLALVKYANTSSDADRRAFIEDYFGLERS